MSGTSAVGIRYRSQSPAILNRSASNFGRLPVPVSAARVHQERRLDLACSRARRVCRSSMKLMSARASRAPAPISTAEARAGHLARRARSRGCRAPARGPSAPSARSRTRAARPRRRTSTLSAALVPTGTLGVRQVRERQQQRLPLLLDRLELGSRAALICWPRCLVRPSSSGAGVLALRAWPARPPRPTCSARASAPRSPGISARRRASSVASCSSVGVGVEAAVAQAGPRRRRGGRGRRRDRA